MTFAFRRFKWLLRAPLTYGANEAGEATIPSWPRYIRITDLAEDGTLRNDSYKSLEPELAEPYLLEEGDLLFARSGATSGKAFLYRAELGPACFAGYLIRAKTNPAVVLPEYVYFFSQCSVYWQQISEATIQATIQNVNAEKYASLDIPLPSIAAQRRIVAYLNRETSEIDRLIAAKERLLSRLAEKRQAVIVHAVTKDFGLAFDKYQRLRFEGAVNYPVVPLKYLSHISGGATPNRGQREYWEGDIPWVSPKDMKVLQIQDSQEHITELGLAAASISLLPPQSLLIVVRGMILAHSLPVALNSVPVTINQDMRALTFDECLLPEFALLYFQAMSSWLLTQVTESAHGTKKLDTQVIDELPMIVFPIEVQKSIVRQINLQSSTMLTLEEKTLKSLTLLHERRSALIAAAVTGQILIENER